MLKKLRRKIIVNNMASVGFVLLIAIVLICASSIQSVTKELYDSLRYELFSADAAQRIQLGEQNNPQKLHIEIPHVHAVLSEDGIWTIYKDAPVSINETSLRQALAHISETRDRDGLLVKQRLAYVSHQSENKLSVMLGDTTLLRDATYRSVFISIILFIISMGVCFLVSLALAHMAVKPVEAAWEKQNQFIADASHELKTPLTVMLANHNIIASHPDETVAQQSQWLRATVEEAEQMRRLIDAMLMLAKNEEDDSTICLLNTDVSALIEEEVLFLEPVAFEANVPLETNIQKDVFLCIDPDLLKKAELQGINLLGTENSSFRMAVELGGVL